MFYPIRTSPKPQQAKGNILQTNRVYRNKRPITIFKHKSDIRHSKNEM
jgi:hypothetical protein